MQRFTDERDAATPDEIWLLEHPPVFTLGMNADPCHVLAAGDIPVVQIDRGGQVTYHGPGQLVVYPLIDMRRRGLGVRDLVTALEHAVIDLVAPYRHACRRAAAMRPACTSAGASWRAWACASAAAAATTAWRSTWTWTSSRSPHQSLRHGGHAGDAAAELGVPGTWSIGAALASELRYRTITTPGSA